MARRPRFYAGTLELPVQGRSEGGGTCRGLAQSRPGYATLSSHSSPHISVLIFVR